MSEALEVPLFISALVKSACRTPRRNVYFLVGVFHLMVMSAAGYGVCALDVGDVGDVWKVIERYEDARGGELRARKLEEEFKVIVSKVSKLRRATRVDGQPPDAGAMAHSMVRESAERHRLRLKGFVAPEEEGSHQVVLEGSFANVVMLIAALPDDLVSFDVRRFTARSLSSHGDRVEVELLIKRSPNTSELSPLCTTDVG